jgi:hypothetical protein
MTTWVICELDTTNILDKTNSEDEAVDLALLYDGTLETLEEYLERKDSEERGI